MVVEGGLEVGVEHSLVVEEVGGSMRVMKTHLVRSVRSSSRICAETLSSAEAWGYGRKWSSKWAVKRVV